MTLDQKISGAAWWVATEFHPFTTEVRGIPANKIRKSWSKATEFRKDLLPRDVVTYENDADSMDGYSFSLWGLSAPREMHWSIRLTDNKFWLT